MTALASVIGLLTLLWLSGLSYAVWKVFRFVRDKQKVLESLPAPKAREYSVLLDKDSIAYKGPDVLAARAAFKEANANKLRVRMLRDGEVIREVL